MKIEMMKVIEQEDVDGVPCIEETSFPLLKKSKLGKSFGKNYGLGKLGSRSDSDASNVLSPKEQAKNEIMMHLQHP